MSLATIRKKRRLKRQRRALANKVRRIVENGIDSLARGPNVATVPWRVETRAVVLNEDWCGLNELSEIERARIAIEYGLDAPELLVLDDEE